MVKLWWLYDVYTPPVPCGLSCCILQVTQLEHHMNVLVAAMFALLFVVSAFMAMGVQIWDRAHAHDDWYLGFNGRYPDYFPGFRSWVLGVSMCVRV